MVADRLWHRARFEMASHGVIDVLLEFAQVDRLGRNAAVTRGFVPRRDKMSRISTSFDDNHNLIHTSNSTTGSPANDVRSNQLNLFSRVTENGPAGFVLCNGCGSMVELAPTILVESIFDSSTGMLVYCSGRNSPQRRVRNPGPMGR